MLPREVERAVARHKAFTDQELRESLAAAKSDRAQAQRRVAELKHVLKYRAQHPS